MAGGFPAPNDCSLGRLRSYTQTYSQGTGHLEPFPSSICAVDYEKTLQNAVLSVSPGNTLRGCYFHYKQALWRRLSHSDLVPEYKVNGSAVRKSFQMIGALHCLPSGDIDMVWRLLHPTLPAEMSDFADYLEYTCLGTSAHPPLFSQMSWNQWDATLCGLPRSSNITEGWHNSFSSLVNCTHPTIWTFLEALKQTASSVTT